MEQSFDYVVVGGGSAGCVAAGRMAAAGRRVLLLECGESAEDNPETLRADGYKDAFANDRVIWERFSLPQSACRGRHLFMGSGRGMGGSGAVNAMVYLRGSKADFTAWEVPGWAWDDVVPDFEALEQHLGIDRRSPTQFTETCIDAAESSGFSRAEDLNDGALVGRLGYEWMNFRGEQRRSSYVAFVRPHEQGPALTVATRARAERLIWDERGRVEAVEYCDPGGRHRAQIRHEVILAAGALETPKLLMLSGVGPGPELRRHGIRIRQESEGVGSNFQDHPNVTLFHAGRGLVDTDYPQLYGFHRANPYTELPADQADTCYVFYPARSSFREALIRMLPPTVLPLWMYRNTPARGWMRGGVKLAFRRAMVRRAIEHVYGIVVILGKPKSRGTVRLCSSNPAETAAIDPGYFTDPQDMETMVRGVRLARRVAGAPALSEWGNTEIMPGRWARSDPAIERFIQNNVMTTYHYGGTCRMGSGDNSVVDEQLRLRGVPNVRIADASIIPTVPVSALNGPSMLIGWRVASYLLQGSP